MTLKQSIRVTLLSSLAAATLALAGCQTAPQYQSQPQRGSTNHPAPAPDALEYGYVSQIDSLQNTHRGSTGAGIALGAVIGGLLGNQVGGGSGRVAATIAGAVGGAVAGNTIESRIDNGQQQNSTYGYRISIHVDNGALRLYDVESPGDLRVGDRVQVRNGQIARMN